MVTKINDKFEVFKKRNIDDIEEFTDINETNNCAWSTSVNLVKGLNLNILRGKEWHFLRVEQAREQLSWKFFLVF